MREGVSGKGSRHWRDNRTLGNRGSFSFYETGMHSETGAKVIASHLLVGPLREEDGGVYRCRVDFREAPTRNTRGAIQCTFKDVFNQGLNALKSIVENHIVWYDQATVRDRLPQDFKTH